MKAEEMTILDFTPENKQRRVSQINEPRNKSHVIASVSYTHLTLPTIYSV